MNQPNKPNVHQRAKQNEQRKVMKTVPHLCQSRDLYFKTDELLDEHINQRHVTDIRKYCPKCSLRPNNGYDLKKHLIKDHYEGLRFFKQPRYTSYDNNQRNGYF